MVLHVTHDAEFGCIMSLRSTIALAPWAVGRYRSLLKKVHKSGVDFHCGTMGNYTQLTVGLSDELRSPQRRHVATCMSKTKLAICRGVLGSEWYVNGAPT